MGDLPFLIGEFFVVELNDGRDTVVGPFLSLEAAEEYASYLEGETGIEPDIRSLTTPGEVNG